MLKKHINLFLILIIIFSIFPVSVAVSESINEPLNEILNEYIENEVVEIEKTEKLHIVFIHGGRTEDNKFMNEVASNPKLSEIVKLTILEGGSVTGKMDEILSFDFSDTDVVIIHNMAIDLVWSFENKMEHLDKKNIIFTTAFNSEHWIEKGYSVDEKAAEYLDYRIEENYLNCILYVAFEYLGIDVSFKPVKTKPVYGIYHPDAGDERDGNYFFESAEEYMDWYLKTENYDENNPTIAVLLDSFKSLSPDGESRDGPMINDLIRLYEKNGANVIYATYSAYDENNLNYLKIDGETIPEAVVVISRGARLPENRTANETKIDGVSDLKDLGVVALNGIRIFNKNINTSNWNDSMAGVPTNEVPYLAMAEMDGLIEPIVIIAKDGPDSSENHLIKEQAEWFVKRSINRAKLNTKITPNSDKKIVIPYYAADAGKASIGTDTDYYLNAPKSLVNVFKNMSERGYDVGDGDEISPEDLADLMVEYGHNIGTWAPGQVEKIAEAGNAALIPENEYTEWFLSDALSDQKRSEVIELWGDAPGNLMIYENKNGEKFIVIPEIKFGNIILSPNPLRGRDQTEDAKANKGAFAPTHQCLAYYYYYNNVVEVDAYLPFYSNIAVMPGKEVTLSSKDWGAILMQDKPIVHILPIDAKGVMDSRRANMQIVSYLTPPLAKAEISGALGKARLAVLDFKENPTDSNLRQIAIENIKKNSLDTAVGAKEIENMSNENLLRVCDNVLEHLKTTENVLIPYGVHTLGEIPEVEYMMNMVKEMVKTDDSLTEEEYVQKIYESAELEIPSLLDALEGKYIPAGLSGDPVRKPDILPSGRGLYSHDARTVPTKEAWDSGVEMVEESIEKYKAKHDGKYPEKQAYLLWAIETGRNNGVMESEILYLLGIKPVWNNTNGRITGFYDLNSGAVVTGNVPTIETESGKLIAEAYSESEKLNRPRIDVLVVTSGSYRDMYSSILQNISICIKYASEVDDSGSGYENFVSKNTALLKEKMIENGYSEADAEKYSTDRIYATAPGEYTPGIEDFVSREGMTREEMAKYYIDRMGYSYGDPDNWGRYNPDIFTMNLENVDTAAFSRSSNLYGVLDHMMVASYFGGLALAADYANGDKPAPDVLIHNLRNEGEVSTLAEFLSADLNSRALNENWIEAMKETGYTGTTFMSEFAEALKLWDSTTNDVVTTEMWESVYENYVVNDDVKDYLSKTNPYAYQSMVGNLLTSESALNLSEDIRENLVSEFAKSVAEYGITCCHHTCGNPSFNDFIIGQMSVAGVNPEIQRQYMKKIKDAKIEYNIDIKTEPPKSSRRNRGSISIEAPDSEDSLEGTVEKPIINATDAPQKQPEQNESGGVGKDPGTEPGKQVRGYTLLEKTISNTTKSITDFLQNPTFSSSSLIVILVIILIVGIVFYGYRKRNM